MSDAPRIALADVEANIEADYYFTAREGIVAVGEVHECLSRLMLCVLVLRNGFTIVGQACASAEKFDPEIGRRLARADAIRQLPQAADAKGTLGRRLMSDEEIDMILSATRPT